MDDPYDAASYLPRQERQGIIHHLSTRHDDDDDDDDDDDCYFSRVVAVPTQPEQFMPQPSQTRKVSSLPSQPPAVGQPAVNTCTSNRHDHSYEWDAQNLSRFQSTKLELLRATIVARSNTPNNNNYDSDNKNSSSSEKLPNASNTKTRTGNSSSSSSSGGKYNNSSFFNFTSPTRPQDSKKHCCFYADDGHGSMCGGLTPPPPPPHTCKIDESDYHHHASSSTAASAANCDDGWATAVERTCGGGNNNNTKNRNNKNKNNNVTHTAAKITENISSSSSSSSSSRSNHNHLPPRERRNEGSTTEKILPLLELHLHSSSSEDYLSCAIRYLLLDTPLPLVVHNNDDATNNTNNTNNTSNNNNRNNSNGDEVGQPLLTASNLRWSEITLHTTRNNNNNNNYTIHNHGNNTSSNGGGDCSDKKMMVYLIPRYYLNKWIQWARYAILTMAIDNWFLTWETVDAQAQQQHQQQQQQHHQQQTHKSKKKKGNSGDVGVGVEKKRYFSLTPETLHTLSALSFIADQYELFVMNNNNDNKDTETNEFSHWLSTVENCWNSWVAKTKKNNNNNNINNAQGVGHGGAIPSSSLNLPTIDPPGPIDSRILCTRRNPLLMHSSHVALSMKGLLSPYHSANNNDVQLIPDEEISKLSSFVDAMHLSTNYDNDQHSSTSSSTNTSNINTTNTDVPNNNKKLAVVPVPITFYDLIRSVHGVVCTDGDVSFAPPPPQLPLPTFVNDSSSSSSSSSSGGGGNSGRVSSQGGGMMNGSNGSNKLSVSCSLLFHYQWKIDTQTAKNRDVINVKRDLYRGYHPYYFTNDHHAKEEGMGNDESPSSTSCPIEFRRLLLPVLQQTSSYNMFTNNTYDGEYNSSSRVYPKIVQSPSSTLMQEAIKSKQSFDAMEKKRREEEDCCGAGTVGGTTTTTSSTTVERSNDTNVNDRQEVVGYAVELSPVEFKYIIVGGNTSSESTTNFDHGAATPLDDGSSSSMNNSLLHGIALASRSSLVMSVLHDIQRAAAPHRSHACVRLWKKSTCASATAIGNGYDLLDTAALCVAPTRTLKQYGGGVSNDDGNGASLKSMEPAQKQQQLHSLTVEEWLGLVPLSVNNICRTNKPVMVELLVEVRNSPTSKWTRGPLELTNRLQVGDYVDAQDSARKWYEAIVCDVKSETTIKVHYFGWGSKWDVKLPRTNSSSGSKLSSPMPLWTKTKNWRELIKVGDEVEIRESTSLVQRPKWHRATVLAVGDENDSPRELVGGAELEELDIKGVGKKAPLLLLNRKKQVLVEVPQEMHNMPSSIPIKQSPKSALVAQPPYRRWVNLYGEEICQANTHRSKTVDKKQSELPATLNYTLESQRAPVEVLKPYNNIHGSGFVRESLRGIPPAAGTVGLHNLGNSCYMNSILQCISHVKPITHFFLNGDYVKEINKMNPLGCGGRLATAYASFLADIYSGEYSIIAPRLLKQTLCCFAPQFNNNYQHDSQEFCQYLMDGLHEDLNRVKSKPYVEEMEALGMEDSKASMESWKKHLLRHDSIFVDYFQGMHRSHLTCPRCGRESIKFDVYSSISLPLVPPKERSAIPLKDCLDQFAAGEQLDSHNSWYCSKCKKHVCALKLITLWNTPDVLIIHLKRFTFEKCPITGRILRRKIDDKVDFPIDRLDLSSYVLGPKDPDAPPIYKLFGVSEHTGSTANSGHYTATVRNSADENWYRYNDSHVGTTCEPAVTGGAYLLFYRRVKGSLRWAGMEKQWMEHGGGASTLAEDNDGFREVTRKKRNN